MVTVTGMAAVPVIVGALVRVRLVIVVSRCRAMLLVGVVVGVWVGLVVVGVVGCRA